MDFVFVGLACFLAVTSKLALDHYLKVKAGDKLFSDAMAKQSEPPDASTIEKRSKERQMAELAMRTYNQRHPPADKVSNSPLKRK